MSQVKLSEYLFIKYASEEKPDMSFGKPITPEKTRILKDKIILVYDKLNEDITRLPEFIELNEELRGDPYLAAFNNLINNLVVNIEEMTLKDGFNYAIKMIDALNRLRMGIRKSRVIEKEKIIQLDAAIHNIQDTIWKESKRILNIHDLRGLTLNYPELKGILTEIKPTWDYGPGKTNAIKPIKQRQHHTKDLIKRLERELAEENKK